MTGKWFKKELELMEKKDLIEQEINQLTEKRKELSINNDSKFVR